MQMGSYVLGFQEMDRHKLMVVGGKGLNLGELSRIQGIRVPGGFCVTTDAYKRVTGQSREYNTLLEQLSHLEAEDREKIAAGSTELRRLIHGLEIPLDIQEEITGCLSKMGENKSYAVRSSATAEDLPLASFAGQQDTYLNVKGKEAILQHISRCWASLFTDRAVTYRIQNGFDHRKVYLSVVVQRMVFPEASGIMFTVDPVTSNRKVLSIDASFGLGEALVSGLVNADIYKVREGKILDKKISAKELAIYALEKGGTEKQEIDPERRNMQALTDEQILQLEAMGREIEKYFGTPQDIEWCLEGKNFYILQSRPITTLFPVPEAKDGKNRVFMSVGHSQMMTDAIKPLGTTFFNLLSDDVDIDLAGGRLFMDLTHDLASPVGRKILLATMGKNDPLTNNALLNLMKRKDFMKSLPRGKRALSMGADYFSWGIPLEVLKIYRRNGPKVVQNLISRMETSVKGLEQKIAGQSGEGLFDFIKQDSRQFAKIMYEPRSMAAIIVGLYAADWLNKHLEKWLGEKGAADTLSQSVANNVTSEMGLALLDVADVVRQYPAVMDYFPHAKDETFFEDLVQLEGGEEVRASIGEYLKKYGMRCPGEIDIARTRWGEKPTLLIPLILNNIKNFEPRAHQIKFEQGRLEAKQKEQELLSRLEQLPGGRRKAKKTKKMIAALRNLIGYREYPKYAIIQRFYIYKQAMLREAARLVQKEVLQEKEDIYYLFFEELREAVRTNRLDYSIITKRKEEYAVFEKLNPPRVMTSEGEVITAEYETGNIPPGALPGLPVSSGTVEGPARVILKMEEAAVEEGDILVTTFTDPSWTPLFVSLKGLVTEVGGLMTHGAVIAREYGLPAVVGVADAVKLIKDGQRIRVNGTEGYVEILGSLDDRP